MADEITARATADDGKFEAHPAGQMIGVCVDLIDLGERKREWNDKGKPHVTINDFCGLVFVSGTKRPDGSLHEVFAEFAVSMHKKGNLRPFLEQWRGRKYTDEEAAKGVPLHKLVGHPALMSIEHRTSKNDRTYAKISAIMPVPKGMPVPSIPVDEYKRGEFWAKKKDEYRAEVARYRATLATHPADDNFEDFDDQPLPGDDELPF